MQEQLVSVREFAKAKGVSESAVRAALSNPDELTVRGVKVGGRVYVFYRCYATYHPRSRNTEALGYPVCTPVGGSRVRERGDVTECSILCPKCGTDFFWRKENGLTLRVCPWCGWPGGCRE